MSAIHIPPEDTCPEVGSRHSSPLPDLATVHRIHDRYQREVVEDLSLCPFARRCRQEGRLHRPVFFARRPQDPTPSACAEQLAAIVRQHPDAEVVLLTFVVTPDHPFRNLAQFDAFVPAVRAAYESLRAPQFYFVAFHPDFPAPPVGGSFGPQHLLPLLRRTPDPVIQSVRADLLEAIRAQAQQNAHERVLQELPGRPPELRESLRQGVLADSELTARIAQANFETVGRGDGREELEQRITDIMRDRDAAYGA
jgi:hypothetical protein